MSTPLRSPSVTPPHLPSATLMQLNYAPCLDDTTPSRLALTLLTLPLNNRLDIRLLIYDLFTLHATHSTITAKTPHGRPPHTLSASSYIASLAYPYTPLAKP